METMITQIVNISPDTASQMLKQNINNRSVSRPLIERLKLSMKRNEWAVNGEAIKIGKDGRILDGQHRLIACVESGATFTTLLITGLSPETQYTMDTGKSRSLANMFQLRGDKNATALAAITNAILRSNKWGLKVGATQTGQSYPITVKEGLDYRDANPGIIDVVRRADQIRRTGLSRKIGGLLYHYFSLIDKEDADYFFDRLLDGVALEKGNPIYTLKRWLEGIQTSSGIRISGLRSTHLQTQMTAYTIKAWNAYRRGESLQRLVFRLGGAKPEQFPEPV